MAEEQKKMVPTLGLTGVTVNAMALIAPGAFLWITFVVQAGYAYPSGLAMWAGIFAALLLAYATAISYSELAKLYPGAGSSYLFAEQAFLGKTTAYKFARIAKFTIGWASHLYYWVYPGVMVATMGVMIGYIVGSVAPSLMNAGVPGPVFMALIAIIFSYAVAWIAFQGVNGSTNVNIAINAIQIVALLFFAALAIAYRLGHPDGSTGSGAGRHLEGVALLFDRRYARSSVWVVSNTSAQLQLDDAAGNDSNPAARWFRISHLARRRGA